MNLDDLLTRCRTTLEGHYGPCFHGLVLFGSHRRAQAEPESDIDFLVLLDEPFDYFSEQKRIIDLLYPLQLESCHLLSAKPASRSDYEAGSLHLYRTIKREGIAV